MRKHLSRMTSYVLAWFGVPTTCVLWLRAWLDRVLSPPLYVVEYVEYEGVCTQGVSAFGGCWASGVLPGWDSAFNYWRWLTFEAPDLTAEYRIVRLRYDDDLAINYRFNYKD